jgi:hypothetical protein
MTNFVIDWLRPTCIGTFNTRSERNLTGGAMAARWGLVLLYVAFSAICLGAANLVALANHN